MLVRIYSLAVLFVLCIGAGCLGSAPLRKDLPCKTDEDCKGPAIALFCNQQKLCEAQACTDGATKKCFSGAQGCTPEANGSFKCTGVCKAGQQICTNGFWGPCVGQVLPTPEICKDKSTFCCDGNDNNCNGQVDEAYPSHQICDLKPPSMSRLSAGAGGVRSCVKGKTSCAFKDNLVYITSKDQQFKMGSPIGESNRGTDEGNSKGPVVTSFSYNFGIGIHEITEKQFKDVMGYNPKGNTGEKQLPVSNVSWHEAAMYTNQLSRKMGLQPCFQCTGNFSPTSGKRFTGTCVTHQKFQSESLYVLGCPGYRLPTEAEWEYAYRAQKSGGVYKKYHGGEDEPFLKTIAHFQKNSGEKKHAVDSKNPNGWGLFNMSGNVAEWVFDYHQDKLVGNNDPIGPRTSSSNMRVHRGGHYQSPAIDCRGASRQKSTPTTLEPFIGFRIVKTLIAPKEN